MNIYYGFQNKTKKKLTVFLVFNHGPAETEYALPLQTV